MNDNGISLVAVTNSDKTLAAAAVYNVQDRSGRIKSSGRIAELEAGDQVIISNKSGLRAVLKILVANTEGYSSALDEVVFEYQIFVKE